MTTVILPLALPTELLTEVSFMPQKQDSLNKNTFITIILILLKF